jgi:hypothetical protein
MAQIRSTWRAPQQRPANDGAIDRGAPCDFHRGIQEAEVAKLEQFVTSVTCPECALNGSATWEEC